MKFDKYGITPLQIADKYLGNYKIKDDEINAEICPFCQSQKDKWTFFLNIDEGTYYCHRQNNCGVQGSFRQLLQHFGEHHGSKYDPQKVDNNNVSKKILDYFKQRGINNSIVKMHDIKEGEQGQIAFEYYEDDELVLVKYRNFKKGKNKKYWQEGGGKPVLWELDNVNYDKPLKITEGEIDKLALHQAGVSNVVSIPFGSNNFEWVENNWDKIDKFDEIIICPDNDDAGEKFLKECANRLGEYRCKVAKPTWPDLNHELYKEGEERLVEIIENAEYIGGNSWLQLHEIEMFDPSTVPSTKSSIPLINKFIRGYREGEISIWTGVNGSGKSTLLLQEAEYAVKEGNRVSIITGESQPGITKYVMSLQLAGADNVEGDIDEISGQLKFYAPKKIKEKMFEWTRNKVFIYNNFEGLEAERIKNKMLESVRRHGVKYFIVDNLMKVKFNASYQEKWNKQSQFVEDMKEFAINHGVHIHIVAHPRKPEGVVVTKEDVAGLYEVTNIADNIICVHRTKNENIAKALGIKDIKVKGAVEIFKNRMYGEQDKVIRLNFENSCRRFWQYDMEQEINFGWEE